MVVSVDQHSPACGTAQRPAHALGRRDATLTGAKGFAYLFDGEDVPVVEERQGLAEAVGDGGEDDDGLSDAENLLARYVSIYQPCDDAC